MDIKTGANEFFYVKDETDKVKTLTPEEYKFILDIALKISKINWETNGWYFSEMNNQHYLMERRLFQTYYLKHKKKPLILMLILRN